jgi:hypothetical protein
LYLSNKQDLSTTQQIFLSLYQQKSVTTYECYESMVTE